MDAKAPTASALQINLFKWIFIAVWLGGCDRPLFSAYQTNEPPDWDRKGRQAVALQ